MRILCRIHLSIATKRVGIVLKIVTMINWIRKWITKTFTATTDLWSLHNSFSLSVHIIKDLTQLVRVILQTNAWNVAKFLQLLFMAFLCFDKQITWHLPSIHFIPVGIPYVPNVANSVGNTIASHNEGPQFTSGFNGLLPLSGLSRNSPVLPDKVRGSNLKCH